MRRWLVPVLVTLMLACGGLPFGDSPPEDLVETRISVRRGARVTALARRLEVDAEELKSWNDLTSGRIPADMELVVWRPAGAPPFTAIDTGEVPVADAPADAPRRRARREGLPDAEETEAHLGLIRALTDEALTGGSLADDLVGGPSVTAEGGRPSTSLSRRSGALASLGRIEGGPAIGPIQRTTDAPATPGVHIPEGPVGSPSVAAPSAKTCRVARADVDLAEDGMAAAQGLSIEQVQLGMLAAARRSLPCFPAGTHGEFVVTAEVTAGCDGRVSRLSLDPGPVPPPVTACVRQVLHAAGFPAHAQPDGVSFTYPLRYRF